MQTWGRLESESEWEIGACDKDRDGARYKLRFSLNVDISRIILKIILNSDISHFYYINLIKELEAIFELWSHKFPLILIAAGISFESNCDKWTQFPTNVVYMDSVWCYYLTLYIITLL